MTESRLNTDSAELEAVLAALRQVEKDTAGLIDALLNRRYHKARRSSASAREAGREIYHAGTPSTVVSDVVCR